MNSITLLIRNSFIPVLTLILFALPDAVSMYSQSTDIKVIPNFNIELPDTLFLYKNNYVSLSYEIKDKNVSSVFYKSMDACQSWSAQSFEFKSGIKHIQFINEFIGYLVTRYGGVFRTNDGGNTWSQILNNVIQSYKGKLAYIEPVHKLSFFVVETK